MINGPGRGKTAFGGLPRHATLGKEHVVEVGQLGMRNRQMKIAKGLPTSGIAAYINQKMHGIS